MINVMVAAERLEQKLKPIKGNEGLVHIVCHPDGITFAVRWSFNHKHQIHLTRDELRKAKQGLIPRLAKEFNEIARGKA